MENAGFGFWIMAGLLAFGVAVYLLRALARGGADAGGDAGEKALSLYQDQLAEIGRDLTRGTIAQAEAERLRTEVQRRVLEAGRMKVGTAPNPTSKHGQTLGFVTVIAALLGTVGLYMNMGAPDYPDLPLSKRLEMAALAYDSRPTQAEAEAATPQPPVTVPDADFAALMEKLRAALITRPDDVQGLTLLARNEALLGNYVAAARAYEALLAARGDMASADEYIGAAQAMIAATGGTVTAQAESALMNTLRLDPTNGLARYFSGLMFAQTGRPDRSFALWEPLLRESPAGAPWVEPITAMLPEVASAAGINYTPPADFERLAQQQLAGPDAEAVAAAADMSEEDRKVMITTMVAGLEERLLQSGGTGAEWARLISSLGILGETRRAEVALRAARAELAADPAAMTLITDAAAQAGLAP